MKLKTINKRFPVIAWWSGGITSAVACYLCCYWFGHECVRIIFMDTRNEDDDIYRFKKDCEVWYHKEIESLYSDKYIEQVWYEYKSLNVATGAICSYILKRKVREAFQRENLYSYQAFGFDISEINRAQALKSNNPDCKPIFPLITELLDKKTCFQYLPQGLFTIEPPRAYKLGYHNNNCFKTGCVQGGIGYWQKIAVDDPAKFDKMAKVEHDLSDLKGEPVTMLKDQGKDGGLVFLKPHPKYPHMKDLSQMKGRPVKPLIECNGFCGTNDLQDRNSTADEINYANTL